MPHLAALGRGLLLLGAGLGGCALIVDLPEPAEEPGGGGAAGRPSGSGAQGGAAASGGGAAGMAAGAGAASGASAGGAGDCVVECDCDGDTHEDEVCGGDDCDDTDDRVFRGQEQYFTERANEPAVGFDFNCDDRIEPDPDRNVSINCGITGLMCVGTLQGYEGPPPPCGDSGRWSDCRSINGVTCEPVFLENRVMPCR